MVQSNECHVCFASLGRSRRGVRQVCDHPYHEACLTTWRQTNPRWDGRCFYCSSSVTTAHIQRMPVSLPSDADPDEDLAEVDGALVRRCPNCRVHFVRDGGCTHMTCRCGHQFHTQAEAHGDNYPILAMLICLIGIVSFVTALTMVLLVSAVKVSRETGVCEPYAGLLHAPQCFPCLHALQLLRAKRDDLVYCDTSDLSIETLLLRLDGITAVSEYEDAQNSCARCLSTAAYEAEEVLKFCYNREFLKVILTWMATLLIALLISHNHAYLASIAAGARSRCFPQRFT